MGRSARRATLPHVHGREQRNAFVGPMCCGMFPVNIQTGGVIHIKVTWAGVPGMVHGFILGLHRSPTSLPLV